MYIIIGIVLLCIGILVIFFPGVLYELTQSWKNDSFSEPSRIYVVSARIGGAILVVVGIVSLLLHKIV